MLLLVYLAPGSLAKLASTKKRTQLDQIATDVCAKELDSHKFDTDVKGRHATLCTYKPALGSWLNCAKDVLDSRKKSRKMFERRLTKLISIATIITKMRLSAMRSIIEFLPMHPFSSGLLMR
ncbi:CGH_1_collapsed_G0053170.mRNA.1.CDS.1 [Saccharomyces cerevisiae]|nr:CGH_1_collapsed_G0053170.mRNA.1.CDS.1 [Saccharomyces cerevisiae]